MLEKFSLDMKHKNPHDYEVLIRRISSHKILTGLFVCEAGVNRSYYVAKYSKDHELAFLSELNTLNDEVVGCDFQTLHHFHQRLSSNFPNFAVICYKPELSSLRLYPEAKEVLNRIDYVVELIGHDGFAYKFDEQSSNAILRKRAEKYY